MELEEGQLVETGSFRVDRAKALEKLSLYQLEDPTLFMLSWVRTAVAGGAINLSFDYDGRTLEIRFDGQNFGKKVLRDPYGGLFAEAGEAEVRLKHFAFGLLGALRLSASEVRVVSGPVGERRRLIVSSLENERIDMLDSATGDSSNAVRVLWPRGEAPEDLKKALRALTEQCRLVPGTMRINGKRVATGPRPLDLSGGESGRIKFNEDGLRGWLDCGIEDASEVSWHHAGVFVISEPLAGLGTGVTGSADSLDFNLTASLSGLVHDEGYLRARERLRRMGRRLLLKCAGERALMLHKQRNLDRKEKWQVRFGRRTFWILDQCTDYLKGSKPDSSDPFKRALWRVPLFSDMKTSFSLSLGDLYWLREETGSILVSDRRAFRLIDQEWDVAWVPDERAVASLAAFFGSAVRHHRVP